MECERLGRITPATVVDHIKPHEGNPEMFWEEDNVQSLCKPCHDSKTAREDGRWGKKSVVYTYGLGVGGSTSLKPARPGAGAWLHARIREIAGRGVSRANT